MGREEYRAQLRNVHGLVDKDVGRAVGRGDEAKALGAVEPLDRALLGAGAGRCKHNTDTISPVTDVGGRGDT
jgi:hypothetical protein